MSVNILINLKGASRKIKQISYEYPFEAGDTVNVKEFLDKTVEITLSEFQNARKEEDALELFRVLSKEEIENQAESGKVGFGVHYNDNTVSYKKAKENARECFADGLVAFFIDAERYESLEDTFSIKDDSEVTFVKLTFLAGRLW